MYVGKNYNLTNCPKITICKIILCESLEPALVGKVSKALVLSPKALAKRARKRKTQHHVVDVLHRENEDDRYIIKHSQQVNFIGPSSPRSKNPKFTHQVPIPPTSSSHAPLSHPSSSMKGRMQILHPFLCVSSLKSLILNDLFVRMVEERQRRNEWPPAYEVIRSFISTIIKAYLESFGNFDLYISMIKSIRFATLN